MAFENAICRVPIAPITKTRGGPWPLTSYAIFVPSLDVTCLVAMISLRARDARLREAREVLEALPPALGGASRSARGDALVQDVHARAALHARERDRDPHRAAKLRVVRVRHVREHDPLEGR